jgi:hypothetical protein
MERIFLDLISKGFMVGVAPSGVFPGGGSGTLAGRSRRCMEKARDLIAFFFLCHRVFSVKAVALFFILLFPRGFDVTLYPLLVNVIFQGLWA